MGIETASRRYTDNLRRKRRFLQGRGVNLRETIVLSGAVYVDDRIVVPGLHDDDDIVSVLNMTDLVDVTGYLDDAGFLWITGRSRRIAKVFGLRLNLDELEDLTRAAAPGHDLAAIGDGDRVVVFVVGADSPLLATVRQAIVARLGVHPTGVVVTALAALPRLASGKIDYRGLEVPA